MTIKPKAKKFRIRRTSVLAGGQAAVEARRDPAEHAPRQLNPLEESVADGTEDGFPDEGFSTAGRGAARPEDDGADDTTDGHSEDELAAIRKEGLTGRQLRMARRLAQKHGLPATSDYDAVRLLRRAGIDPFHRANMLELVSAEGFPGQGQGGNNLPQRMPGGAAAKLPQTVPPQKAQLPSTKVMDAADRARSVMEIQRDIARRRRRRLLLLFTRLTFFVFLPTILAGYYFYAIATPMYATKSEFVIQKAESGQSGLGSLFAG